MNPARLIAPRVWPQLRVFFLLIALLALGPRIGAAADGDTKSFFLPAGSAAQTLKQFAEQSGRGVVFVTEVVKDARTNAVQGELAPAAALRQLLAGTALVAEEDVKTGAFAVRKGAADPNAPRAAPVAKSDRPTNPSHADTIVMTPFEVRTDSGDAYGVTQSNRATMFNADTTKLPINSETFTSQLLQDIDMQDMDILVSGLATAGGWGSMQNDTSAFSKQPGDRVANAEFKLRGVGAGGVRRDGLISSNNSSFNDTFSTESIEILSGPNALLYAGSGGGGVISAISKQARFEKNTGSISLRTDEWGTKRYQLDGNQSSSTGLKWIPQIASRLALMQQSQGLYRTGFGNKASGEYLQLAARLPYRSTLRVSYTHSEAIFWQGSTPSIAYQPQTWRPPAAVLALHTATAGSSAGQTPTLAIGDLFADAMLLHNGALDGFVSHFGKSRRTYSGGLVQDYNHNPKDNYYNFTLETRWSSHLSSILVYAHDNNTVNMVYTGNSIVGGIPRARSRMSSKISSEGKHHV